MTTKRLLVRDWDVKEYPYLEVRIENDIPEWRFVQVLEVEQTGVKEHFRAFRSMFLGDFVKHVSTHVVVSDDPEGVPTRFDVPKWDEYFLTIASAVATRAKCRRRQVGAIIVDSERRLVSSGYNGFPAGIPDCLEGNCPRGLTRVGEIPPDSPYTDPNGPGFCPATHAELNALLVSTKSSKGCTIYVTHSPCPDCQRLIASAGIIRVVWPGGEMDPKDFFSD